MNIDEIIESFNSADGYFPNEALNVALEQQEAITPRLLSILGNTVLNYKNTSIDQMDYIFALYLLSKFREKKAFPYILALASLPGKWPDDLLGDCIAEGLRRFIVSTFDGDISAIKKIVENTSLNEWAREAALRSFLGLVALDKLGREEIINYFRSLFHSPLFDDEDFVTHLVDITVALYPEELLDEINRAFEEEKVDPICLDKEWVEDIFADGKEKCLENYVYNDCSHLPIDDVAKEMAWMNAFMPKAAYENAGHFEYGLGSGVESNYLDDDIHHFEFESVNTYVREIPKIGRNDPCLCGSGKKFKKCCLSSSSKVPADIAENHDEYLYGKFD